MFTKSVSIADVEDAYRKLKHHFFYDNSQLFIRHELAQYELGSIDTKLQLLTEVLNGDFEASKELGINALKKKIGCFEFPKKFLNKPINSNEKCYSNQCSDSFEIEGKQGIFYYINAPIPVHIFSVLWIKFVGWKLQTKYMLSDYCMGNVLILDSEKSGVATGMQLFKPYFSQYNKWRKDGMQTANDELSQGRHVGLLSLDISNFYHSVEISTELIAKDLDIAPDSFEYRLTAHLVKIHKIYAACLTQKGFKLNKQPVSSRLLPIGLLSSGVLANWYLRDLDRKILDVIRPVYYGRYVDDVLIVVNNPNLVDDAVGKVPENILKREKLFTNESGDWTLDETVAKGIKLSDNKLNYFDFHPDHPKALLESINEKIRENSSEYRFLPDEDSIRKTFDETTHVLQFRHGESGKIRDVEALFPSKFLITRFLTANLFYSINLGHSYNEASETQILRFFKGQRAVENYAQWERIVVTLAFHQRWKALSSFLENVQNSIDKISFKTGRSEDTKETLRKHLEMVLLFGAALEYKLFEYSAEARIFIEQRIGNTCESIFKQRVQPICRAVLQRQHYLSYPVFAYTQYGRSAHGKLLSKSLPYELSKDYIQIDWNYVRRFSPRRVAFYEIALWQFWRNLLEINTHGEPIRLQDFDEIKKIYSDLNQGTACPNIDVDLPPVKHHCESVEQIDIHDDCDDSLLWNQNLAIALANIRFEEAVLQTNLENFPQTYPTRIHLDTIFNQVTKYNIDHQKLGGSRTVDMLVFPELSISGEWVYGTCKQARKEFMSVVGGLQHIVVGDMVLNIVASIVPIMVGSVKDVVPVFRLKNYYAPSEKELIENLRNKHGQQLKAIEPSEKKYHLFKAKGVQFSVYNCFELTDIRHRALMRGDLDFMIACEWNRDVAYFSNIVEASARDLHCYVVQANNAKYGDSRIASPSRTELMNLLQIKGGINPAIVVSEIDIDSLRQFQRLGFTMQKENKKFKPTPAGYEKEAAIKRARRNTK